MEDVVLSWLDSFLVELEHLLEVLLHRHRVKELFLDVIGVTVLEGHLLFRIDVDFSILPGGHLLDVAVLTDVLLLHSLAFVLDVFYVEWSPEQMSQTAHVDTVIESDLMAALQHVLVKVLALADEPSHMLTRHGAFIFVSQFGQSQIVATAFISVFVIGVVLVFEHVNHEFLLLF